MANSDIKQTAKSMNVFLWEIAEKVGVTDFTLSRRLRRELPQAEKEKLITVIKAVAAEKGRANE